LNSRRYHQTCVSLLRIGALFLCTASALTAAGENGLPYIRNFSPKDYAGGTQNFAVVQDDSGIMYFGNNDGVLVFDGVSWRCIQTPRRSIVRSLGIYNNRIFVGGQGELGYLSPDSRGRLTYISLLEKIPASDRTFKEVYETEILNEVVYFRTHQAIFRWADDKMTVWKPMAEFGKAKAANGALFVLDRGVGLMRLVEDALEPLPGCEFFARTGVRDILSFTDSTILIGTFSDGLFLFDGGRLQPFTTEATGFVEAGFYRGLNLSQGLIALGTLRGLAVIDKTGKLRRTITKKHGLANQESG